MITAFLILLRILGIVLVLALATWALIWLGRIITRLSAAVLIGALTGLIAGLIASGIDGADAGLTGVVTGLVAMPVALAAIWRRGERSRLQPAARTAPPPPEPPSPEPPPILEPAADSAVTQAWLRAEDLAPGQAGRLAAARRACAVVLNRHAAGELDFGIIDTATFIRKNVPSFVSTTARLWDSADADERRKLAEDLVSGLEDFARRATRDNERQRQDLRDELAALRSHIANRADGD